MKILILGIGNILFGDEGVGVHLANLIDQKYGFFSKEHKIDIMDGGTLAQRLIPIITKYDHVIIIDCVTVANGQIADIYFFDFNNAPKNVTWQGSAHEVEMLQTLEMIEIIGDLPRIKILGVVPFVIGENSTFTLSTEVQKATILMEKTLINYLKKINILIKIKKNLDIGLVAKGSFLRGVR